MGGSSIEDDWTLKSYNAARQPFSTVSSFFAVLVRAFAQIVSFLVYHYGPAQNVAFTFGI